MKKRVLLALAVLPLAAASDASATLSFKSFDHLCSVGTVRACASIRLTTVSLLGGGTQVTMRVRNEEGTFPHPDGTGGSLLTTLAITVPSPLTANSALQTYTEGNVTNVNSAEGFWDFFVNPNTGSGGQGINGVVAIGWASNDGQEDKRGGILGCNSLLSGDPARRFETCGSDGETGWVVFRFTTVEDFEAANAQVGYKIMFTNNPNDIGGYAFECRTEQATCATASPEPVTMTLLGTGLLGLAGVGARRRRRQKSEEDA